MHTQQNHTSGGDHRDRQGKLLVVGIGPGSVLDRTHRAEDAIRASDVVVGYKLYLEHIADLTAGKELIATGMMQEVARCRMALERAMAGATVAFVSSGDAGVYGMAGLAMEMAAAHGWRVPMEVIPGVSAANSAAAKMGAPLMLDYACVSLSDLLMPWDTIVRRIKALAEADMVVALYNPKSTKRVRQIAEVAAIFLEHRAASTPVGIATAVGAAEESVVMSNLGSFLDEEITMKSIVIVGNSTSEMLGDWFVTPRGYKV
jgi:precorrin-3B C17-methyltransferase